jgi:hypothetical protein
MTDLYPSEWHKRIALTHEQRIRHAERIAGRDPDPSPSKEALSAAPANARPASEHLHLVKP